MKNEQGQTIIEIMIALGAIVVLLSAITVIILVSINGANYSRDQNNATEYAQQGMEIMRALRDTDYGQFSGLNGSYCMDQSCTSAGNCTLKSASSCPVNINNYFSRLVTVTPLSSSPADCKNQGQASTEVTMKVSWSDGKCTGGSLCENILLNSCLSNSNVPPKP